MSGPYTSPQNGKAKCIIHSVNNVIRTLLIQASPPGCYWVKGFYTTTYLLNHLPTTTIHAACPHLALFGSVSSYEHLRIFGCTCYPNTIAIVPHKLSPRSTRCVFLGYSADHKGYCCLDLSTNRLIVFHHVVFDEDSFPLAALPSLTDLYFLCESGPTVSTIGTHLTTAGTSPPAPRQPAPEIPPGFEPPVANLPTPAVPPGFLSQAATTAAPPPVTIGPPTHTWSASPVTYVRREVGARAAGTRGVPRAELSREVGAGATGTCGTPRAALCREVGAGAAPSQAEGTGATGHPQTRPKPGGGCWSHGDTWRPRSCPVPGGGRWSHGATWHPRSCPTPRGGRRCHGDMWWPRSCPKPGGGSQSRGDKWRP
jgi:hypothetical protein